jgi:hypothetical protein
MKSYVKPKQGFLSSNKINKKGTAYTSEKQSYYWNKQIRTYSKCELNESNANQEVSNTIIRMFNGSVIKRDYFDSAKKFEIYPFVA